MYCLAVDRTDPNVGVHSDTFGNIFSGVCAVKQDVKRHYDMVTKSTCPSFCALSEMLRLQDVQFAGIHTGPVHDNDYLGVSPNDTAIDHSVIQSQNLTL